MDLTFILEKGGPEGQLFRIAAGATVVGRRRGCDLRIPSESVSRRHCRLLFQDDFLTVEDLASVNGTLVNGKLVARPTIVHPGDRLTIGSITFLVQYKLTPKAIERLLEEQQKEAELLPTFDANESSLPVALAEDDEASSSDTKREVGKSTKRAPSTAKKDPAKQIKPDASIVLEGQDWRVPSGQDIRDILSGLDNE